MDVAAENTHPAKRRRTTPPVQETPFADKEARSHADTLQLRLANAAAIAHNRSAIEAERISQRARSISADAAHETTTDASTFMGVEDVRPVKRKLDFGDRLDEPPLPLINDPVAVSPGPNAKGIHKKRGPYATKNKAAKTTKPKTKAIAGTGGRAKHRLLQQPRVSVGYWDATVGVGGDASKTDGATNRHAQPAAGPNPIRGVPEPDGNEDKRKERDQLREQLSRLKRDLRIIEKEEDRAKRHTQKGDGLFSLRYPEHTLRLLGRHLLPPEEEEEPSDPQRLAEAMLNPIAWLPFGNTAALVEATADADQEWMPDKDEPPPPSHHPIEMPPDEELVFLQLFTPFALSQTMTLDRPENALMDPTIQRQTIDISSRAPRGAFCARIHIVVDTSTLAITDLSFPRLDPAAVPELGPFLDGLCRRDRTRGLANNVSIATWAMGEWYRVALQRAAFWRLLHDEMGTPDGVRSVVGKMRGQRRYRKRRDESNSDDEGEVAVEDVLPYMGTTYHEVAVGVDAFVRMQWRIAFDWTGDARSELSVLFGVPGKWIHADERGVLGNVAGLWRNLVDEGEKPATVVRTLVALLAGED